MIAGPSIVTPAGSSSWEYIVVSTAPSTSSKSTMRDDAATALAPFVAWRISSAFATVPMAARLRRKSSTGVSSRRNAYSRSWSAWKALTASGTEVNGVGHRHLERAPLALVHHVDAALQHHVGIGHAFLHQPAVRLRLHRAEAGLDIGRVGGRRQRQIGLREVVAHVDQQAAQRRRHPRIGRHDHGRDRKLPGQRHAVQRAGAARRRRGRSRAGRTRG